jgi:hypothetical protein
MLRGSAVLLLAALAGCGAVTPPPDTARVPPNSFGLNANPDIGALNQASWAFASAARTRGRPIEAARGVAALDYMAGELWLNPRFAFVSPIPKERMLQARVAVRQVLGIAPNTPSQVVVDGMLEAANALAAGDPAGAERALPPPVFSPDILQRLNDMPYVQIANVATTLAQNEVVSGRGGGGMAF